MQMNADKEGGLIRISNQWKCLFLCVVPDQRSIVVYKFFSSSLLYGMAIINILISKQ